MRKLRQIYSQIIAGYHADADLPLAQRLVAVGDHTEHHRIVAALAHVHVN